jgi:MerR family transcriptional regulator, light-induced transcriptional regulator
LYNLLMVTAAPATEPNHEVGVRIGELSRRVGISPQLLRAWERRYHLLAPARSHGGYRLYSDEDELRIRAMQDHLARGLSAAEAAALVRGTRQGHPAGGGQTTVEHSRALKAALDAYDEAKAHQTFDRMLEQLPVTSVLADVVLPYLAELGTRWENGTVDVAQEHFASNLIRGRLAALARGWGGGSGPRALLACPEGELHDLPVLAFGIALHDSGWQVTFLGANTPITDVAAAVRRIRPNAVVLAAVSPNRFTAIGEELRGLTQHVPVFLAGSGATAAAAEAVGAPVLPGDPMSEAMRLREYLKHEGVCS